MSDFSEDSPFYGLEGKDGFHVVKVTGPATVCLHFVTYQGGDICTADSGLAPSLNSRELSQVALPATEAKLAELDRLYMVLDAVMRFFNTGGTWDELLAAVTVIRTAIPTGLHFEGYHYCRSNLTSDGYQHVFVANDGSGHAVLWQEPEHGDSGMPVGGWLTPTTLAEIFEQEGVIVEDEDWSE